ncbi:cytidylyltransferase domain-containing protein [Pectobacterium parvum]|uniref:acylneuraminate cytidylyltransferase family protein n=1 Tax=Pectobacterium parvum TaxID=2778550 RepID=UPI000DD0B4EB|nr:acylneuraminate cytidylyltransferase family protein [Pectobacterium parvum]MCU1800325.1 acylneuraminate cytidylyltransferase family protein [Pectobacterium parvum]
MKKSTLAIIPARGGSKRLPRKNVKLLHGKPLIAWTIDAALAAKTIDDVIVSTDDGEIASIARQYGAQVPFIRPASLASDTSTTEDVIRHAVDFMSVKNNYDKVIILQPTSPLRTAENIDEANLFFDSQNANAVVSVTECEHNPNWINGIDATYSLEGFMDAKNFRKGKFYRLNGAMYIIKKELSSDFSVFYKKESFAYIMSNKCSVDIDTEIDFEYASFLFNK